jgi:toxin CptA
MHNAPSVSYPVGRPRFAGLLAAGLWLVGAGVTAVWVQQADAPGWRQVVATIALAVLGSWALFSWLRSPSGQLQWDGAGWAGPAGAAGGAPDVALDLQQVLLVRWQAPASPRWLWLERSRCPQRWLDLRRAVYSRARPQALSAARPPGATP